MIAKTLHKRRTLLLDVDIGFVVVLVEEDDGGVEHYGHLVIKLHYVVDARQRYAVEGRSGRDTVDGDVALIYLYCVVLRKRFEKQGDIELIGAFGTRLAGFIYCIYDFLCNHVSSSGGLR